MTYNRTTWANGPGGGTPMDADALNNIETGIATLDATVSELPAVMTDIRFAGGIKESNTAAANDTAIAAAISSGAKVLYAPAGTYHFAAHHEFGDVDLQGAGGGDGTQFTTFWCDAAGAQFEFSKGGALTRGFAIQGDNVANNPFLRSGGTGANGRAFQDVRVTNAVQTTAYFLGGQNDLYMQCGFEGSQRDVMLFDGGAGGITFLRCEIYNAARYKVYFNNAVDYSMYGAYTQPSDIVFDHCLFEGNSGTSDVYVYAGYEISFRDSRFFAANGAVTGPMIDVVAGANINFYNTLIFISSSSGTVAGTEGIHVRGSSTVSLHGEMIFENIEECVVMDGVSCVVSDFSAGITAHYSVGNRHEWLNGANTYQGLAEFGAGLAFDRQQPTFPILASFSYLKAALRFAIDSTGRHQWGPGTSFAFDVGLTRRGVGAVGVDAGTQQVLVTGSGTTAQRPSASVVGAGATYFNTDVGQLQESNGTGWAASGRWRSAIDVDCAPVASVGTIATTAVSIPNSIMAYNSSAAVSDSVTFRGDVSPGTWSARVWYSKLPNAGVVNVDYSLDEGTTWVSAAASVDMYAASAVTASVDKTGIVVTTQRTILFRWTVTGKNSSSTANIFVAGRVSMTRTA